MTIALVTLAALAAFLMAFMITTVRLQFWADQSVVLAWGGPAGSVTYGTARFRGDRIHEGMGGGIRPRQLVHLRIDALGVNWRSKSTRTRKGRKRGKGHA